MNKHKLEGSYDEDQYFWRAVEYGRFKQELEYVLTLLA